jgi:hypothetical protein
VTTKKATAKKKTAKKGSGRMIEILKEGKKPVEWVRFR